MSILDEIRGVLPRDDQPTADDTYEFLRKRITVLSDRVWENRIDWPAIERWLNNFDGKSGLPTETERLHALFVLSQFLYFGSIEIRVLLRALFRDLFLIPLIQELRIRLGGTRDCTVIRPELERTLDGTRFLGVGNPSESGVHLLYYFRQENRLHKKHFMDSAQIFSKIRSADGSVERSLAEPSVERYVFVDDVCGSGETAIRYSRDFLDDIVAKKPDVKLQYLAMFATDEGLQRVRDTSLFGQGGGAVFELDASYRYLSEQSRYLLGVPPHIDPTNVRAVVRAYGELLWPGHGCGYDDSQMLIGFHHNTPDNTLPIIWAEGIHHAGLAWTPAFRRYPKL